MTNANGGARKRPAPRTYVRPTVTPAVPNRARGFVPLAYGQGRKRMILPHA